MKEQVLTNSHRRYQRNNMLKVSLRDISFTPLEQEPVASTSNQQSEPSRSENLERFNDIEDRYEA